MRASDRFASAATPIDVVAFFADFGTDEACFLHACKIAWPAGFVCDRCRTPGWPESFRGSRLAAVCPACERRHDLLLAEGEFTNIASAFIGAFTVWCGMADTAEAFRRAALIDDRRRAASCLRYLRRNALGDVRIPEGARTDEAATRVQGRVVTVVAEVVERDGREYAGRVSVMVGASGRPAAPPSERTGPARAVLQDVVARFARDGDAGLDAAAADCEYALNRRFRPTPSFEDVLGLRRRPDVRAPSAAAVPPTRIGPSEKAWAEARRREAIVREILASPTQGQAVAAQCAARGIANSTLYRWMNAYREGGLRGLVPHTAARGGAGKSRLGTEREALLDDIAQRFHERRPRQSFRQAYPAIVEEFRARGMAPPGVNTARAHIAGRRARR